MKYKNKNFVISLIFLIIFKPAAYSAEVLVDSGQRQTVLERTKQYAGKVDALDIRVNADLNFQKNLKVHSGGSTSGENAKCGGYTISSCGVPCCGEQECKSVCTANMSIAHGNTCLSEYTTSPCGMSCCGKEDCDRVCYNYRASTVNTEKCGGYIKTATGESCCGLEDCRNKNCGEYTSTVTADYGTEEKCCGEKNCLDVKCDYSHSTDVISGGTAKCCGTKDCYSKYCEEITAVDSKVYPDKKNLACCGKENCHQVECDGYTQTNTPSGIRQCCGYEDCRDKECQYRRTATNQKGEKVACCGIEECGNIESKTYTEPSKQTVNLTYVHNYTGSGTRTGSSGGSNKGGGKTYHTDTYYANFNLQVKSTVKTGVALKVPTGCTSVKEEIYDNQTYYHYKCVTGGSSDYVTYKIGRTDGHQGNGECWDDTLRMSKYFFVYACPKENLVTKKECPKGKKYCTSKQKVEVLDCTAGAITGRPYKLHEIGKGGISRDRWCSKVQLY